MKLFNENTPLLMVPDFDDLEILPYKPNNKPMLPDGGCFWPKPIKPLLQLVSRPETFEWKDEKKPIYWITC